MTLKEKAKKLASSVSLRKDIPFQDYIRNQLASMYYTGAVENGVIWHDLRKNPNGLPKEVGHYIVCYLDTAGEKQTFELSFVDWFEDKHWIDEDNHNVEGFDEGVIAWCDIPQYTEE